MLNKEFNINNNKLTSYRAARANEEGWTFIELLFTLSVIGMLMFVFISALIHFQYRNQLASLMLDIHTAVQYGKMQALTLDQTVLLQPLVANHWESGLKLIIMKKQYNEDKSQLPRLLHQWQWHYPGWQIQWKGFQSQKFLIFAADLKKAGMSGRFILSFPHKSPILLILNRLGRIRAVPSLI